MKSVIFDLGGVVFDWNPNRIIQTFMEPLSLSGSEQQQLAATLKQEVFDHQDWLETDKGLLNEADAAQRFAERTDCPISEMERLLTITSESLTPFPETLELIDDLAERGVPLYVLSNMPAERGAYLLDAFDFWGKFGGIVLSGDIHLIKPDEAIYRYILDRYKLDATSCAFLDDSMPNIVAAESIGIHALHFTNAQDCRAALEHWLAS